MDDDFNFDDFGDFDFGDSGNSNQSSNSNQNNSFFDDSEQSVDDDIEEYYIDDNDGQEDATGIDLQDLNSSNASGNIQEDRKATRKQALVVAGIGIGVAIIIFVIVGFIRNNNKTTTKTNNKPATTQTQPASTSGKVATSSNTVKTEWSSFTSDNSIAFSDDYISVQFSVTSIQHYVRVSNDNNIQVKSVLRGALDGFNGVYEIELPYSKASKLSIGDKFSAQVKLGKYSNNITVVDEIKY